MTFQQWWNSRHRSDFEEELYCRLREVWEEATLVTEKKCCEIAEKQKIGQLSETQICIDAIITEIEESD